MLNFGGDLLATHFGLWGPETTNDREALLRANHTLVEGCDLGPGRRVLDAGLRGGRDGDHAGRGVWGPRHRADDLRPHTLVGMTPRPRRWFRAPARADRRSAFPCGRHHLDRWDSRAGLHFQSNWADLRSAPRTAQPPFAVTTGRSGTADLQVGTAARQGRERCNADLREARPLVETVTAGSGRLPVRQLADCLLHVPQIAGWTPRRLPITRTADCRLDGPRIVG